MFLNHQFLRYGKPLAAAAPIILALSGLSSPAHACTGAANDPSHCINNGQAIDGFGEFYNSNLTGVPGAPGVPGSRGPGDALEGILEGFAGLAGSDLFASDPGSTTGTTDEGEPAEVAFDGEAGIEIFVRGDFGTVTLGESDAALEWALRESADIGSEPTNGFRFDGVADNGLKFGARVNFDDFDGVPNTDPGEPNLSASARTGEGYFHNFLGGYGDGGPSAAEIDAEAGRFRRAPIVADNGIKINAEIQLESGGDDVEYKTIISGSFGTILLGEDARDLGFSLGAPDSFAVDGVIRPQITLDNGLTIGVDFSSGRGAAGGIPEGADKPIVRLFDAPFGGYRLNVNNSTDTPDISAADRYVTGFGDIRLDLSDRWGVDGAATNFAVGQASVEDYGKIEGVGIKSFGYVPLDEFNIKVDYNLDGSITTTTGNPGSTAPAPVASTPPPAPVEGTQVGSMGFANQGQRSEVNLIRTEDGKIHAVDKETGHDFGTVHESRSGFGWSFDNQPVPAPAPTQTAAADPIATLDQETIFRDGFESGDTTAWIHSGPGF